MDDKDQAFAARGYCRGNVYFLLDGWRADDRFDSLLKKMPLD